MTRAADSDAKSVGEERRVMRRLVEARPPALQRYARFYILTRWNVLPATERCVYLASVRSGRRSTYHRRWEPVILESECCSGY